MKILACDLGKFKTVVCIYETQDNSYKFVSIKTTPQEIHDLVVKHEPDRVVVEICSIVGWIYDLITSLGFEVQVANTNGQAWQWKNVKRKTDRDDALKLARLSAMEQLMTVHIPKPQVREKRALINYRQSLVQRQTKIKNSIRAIINRQGLEMLPGKKAWSQKEISKLEQMALPFSRAVGRQLWRGQLWMELQQLEQMGDAVIELEQKLAALNKQDKQVMLLQTVPGVGARLAEAVAAYLDEPERFVSGKQVGCYLGLTPRQYQSGNMNRQGRISGQGNKLLRSLLVEVCWLGLRWNAWMRQTYERIMRGSKSRKKIAITALARKLLVRLWAMLRDGTVWREPALEVTV
jgi:transposase